MPAAVMAATEIEPMARCSTAAISQAMQDAHDHRGAGVGGEEVAEHLVEVG